MAKNIRFGEYVQAVTVDSNTISYDRLMPKPRLDKNGNEITSKPEKLKLAGADIANLLNPYFNSRFMEQARAVVPLALFLALFQYIVLQRSVADATLIGGGLIDPHSTTEEFRKRYLDGIRAAAEPWLFPVQQRTIQIVPAALGELSQAIGASLTALYTWKSKAA